MPPESTPYSRTYHLSPFRLWSMPVGWAVIVLLLLWGAAASDPSPTVSAAVSGTVSHTVAPPPDDRSVMLMLAGILTVIMLPFFAILWQSRLVVTHLGIAHHQLGYTVRSTWQNLIALDLTPHGEALVLDQPGTRSGLLRVSARLVAGAAPGAAGVIGNPNLLADGRLINLTPFMRHWKRGPLEQDVRRFAPHLFAPNGVR